MSGKGQDQERGTKRDARKRPRESTSHGRTEPSSQGAGGDISAALAKQREDYQRNSDLQMEQQAAAVEQNPFRTEDIRTSLPEAPERASTITAGQPGLGRAPGPSASGRSRSRPDPMSISAIVGEDVENAKAGGKGQDIGPSDPKAGKTTSAKGGEKSQASGKGDSSLPSVQPGKGKEKPATKSKGKGRASPSDEPPKKRPAVAQPSSGTTQPGSLSQSAVDPIWTEEDKLELAAIKWYFNRRISAENIRPKLGGRFTAESIREQLKLLGTLTDVPDTRPYKGKEEKTVITMTKRGNGVVQIASTLNRTIEDIENKISELSETNDLTPDPVSIGIEYDPEGKKK